MPEDNAAFVGSIPAAYDRYLGPMFFAPHADDLVGRFDWSASRDVLELAAGSGIATERLRSALPAAARLTATDLNAAMLDLAQARMPGADVTWQTADAMALPFPAGAFDDVVCQFGIMFFPDKLHACREVQRVLRPRGRFIFNVWGPLSANPIARITNDVVPRYFKHDAPDFYQVPFGFHDESVLRETLRSAGFEDITLTPVDLVAHSPSALDAATGTVTGNPVIDAIRDRATAPAETVIAAVAEALAAAGGAAPMVLPMRSILVMGRSRA